MKTRNVDDHVAELLSGYLDKELTQQQQQQVEVHIENCETCIRELDELTSQRSRIGNAHLGVTEDQSWGEQLNDSTVRTSHIVGWLLLIGGMLAIIGIAAVESIFDSSSSLLEKLVFGAVFFGCGLLFYSVLRQRLIERKTDKYKDVEI